jgi:hypothetical protein
LQYHQQPYEHANQQYFAHTVDQQHGQQQHQQRGQQQHQYDPQLGLHSQHVEQQYQYEQCDGGSSTMHPVLTSHSTLTSAPVLRDQLRWQEESAEKTPLPHTPHTSASPFRSSPAQPPLNKSLKKTAAAQVSPEEVVREEMLREKQREEHTLYRPLLLNKQQQSLRHQQAYTPQHEPAHQHQGQQHSGPSHNSQHHSLPSHAGEELAFHHEYAGEESTAMGELMVMALELCEDDVEAADSMTADVLRRTHNGRDIGAAMVHMARTLQQALAAKAIARVWRRSREEHKHRHNEAPGESGTANEVENEVRKYSRMVGFFIHSTGQDAETARFYVDGAVQRGLGVPDAITHFFAVAKAAESGSFGKQPKQEFGSEEAHRNNSSPGPVYFDP